MNEWVKELCLFLNHLTFSQVILLYMVSGFQIGQAQHSSSSQE